MRAGDPCPRCDAPLVTIIFGIPGAPSCTACLWPDDDPCRCVQTDRGIDALGCDLHD